MISARDQKTTVTKSTRRSVLNFAAGALWYLPHRFAAARVCGPYSLRCVLFHNISDTESAFTKGLGGTITRHDFEAALRFFIRHYTPVSLQEVLSSFDGQPLPARPILITFDDAYASVSEVAVPLCAKLRAPGIFFVNAACLDNKRLALDNLVCFVVNTLGLEAINRAIGTVSHCEDLKVGSLREVFSQFLPCISLAARDAFRNALIRSTGATESELATAANLYLRSHELGTLTASGIEIGSHTYTHVHCRVLSGTGFEEEVDRNKARLEEVSGTVVRSFSLPYGSSADLTPELLAHLRWSGYEAVFLAEGSTNTIRRGYSLLDRVSIKANDKAELFAQIEVLPRLRAIRNLLVGAMN